MSQPTVVKLATQGQPFDAAREANHRIANNLALAAAALHVQARAIGTGDETYSAAEVREMLAEAAGRLSAITHLHRALSQNFGTERIDIGQHLRVVCDAIITACARRAAMTVDYDLSHCLVSPDRAGPIGLIVTEFVTNAIKHAHPTGIDGRIDVRCRQLANGGLQVEVCDDGVGLPENLDPQTTKSVGFELVRALAKPMNGCVSFKDEGLGLSVRLDIPA